MVLTLPDDVAREQGIREGDLVDFRVRKRRVE